MSFSEFSCFSNFLIAEHRRVVYVDLSFYQKKVIIVDDEPEVHAVTKLALSDFSFQDKRLEFISAYSGKEAEEKIIAFKK